MPFSRKIVKIFYKLPTNSRFPRNNKNIKTNAMKTFELTIFKGNERKQTKTVKVSSQEDLKAQKNGFWLESPYNKANPKNWMGTKRIR